VANRSAVSKQEVGKAVMDNGGALPLELGRYGEPVAGGGVSFRCAACGEVAAVVRLVPAGTPVNMGPPFGEETYERTG
jgi:hypothetical protein